MEHEGKGGFLVHAILPCRWLDQKILVKGRNRWKKKTKISHCSDQEAIGHEMNKKGRGCVLLF